MQTASIWYLTVTLATGRTKAATWRSRRAYAPHEAAVAYLCALYDAPDLANVTETAPTVDGRFLRHRVEVTGVPEIRHIDVHVLASGEPLTNDEWRAYVSPKVVH